MRRHSLLFPLAWLSVAALAGVSLATEKPHLVMVIAEGEYKTEQTLPPFAAANLAQDFKVTIVQADPADRNNIPGIKQVATADVVLLSIRRRVLPPDQLAAIREYIKAGKPVVAIRTSCHAFCLRNERPPAGLDDWPDFDPEIIGGHYVGHHGNSVKSYVKIDTAVPDHPILQGVRRDEFHVFGSLYKCQPLADSTTQLMTGRAEGVQPREPVAWTNTPKSGNRVFYTSLGHPHDFKLPSFVRLLRNGVYWAADMENPDRDVVVLENPPDK